MSSPELSDLTLSWIYHFDSKGTRRLYRGILDRFAVYLQQRGRDLYQATPLDVDLYFEDLDNAGKSPSTRKTALACLKSFYKWALSSGHVSRDPTLTRRLPKAPRLILSKTITPAQIMEIAAAAETARDRAIILVLYLTGLRRSAVASLRRRNITYAEDGSLRVEVIEKGSRRHKCTIPAVIPDYPGLVESVPSLLMSLFDPAIGQDAPVFRRRHSSGIPLRPTWSPRASICVLYSICWVMQTSRPQQSMPKCSTAMRPSPSCPVSGLLAGSLKLTGILLGHCN